MKPRSETKSDSIVFQSYLFNTRAGILTKENGEELFMEHRLRDTFLILLENQNEFVSKDDLMKHVWKETIVSDQSVPKAISDLRRFFVSNELEDLKISTVRKLGYRLEMEAPPRTKSIRIKQLLPYTVGVALLLIFLILHH